MSENTDVNQSESGSGAAPRRSRRAIREAERAAEREAILTGQQPLLTRREMRRLREEAEALQRALEAGEITPEQARALQDPLADQPVISVPAHEATGQHAVASTPADAVPAEQTTPTPATAESPAEPEEAAGTEAEAAGASEAEVLEEAEPEAKEAGADADSEADSEAASEAEASAESEAASPAQAESVDQAASPSAPTPAQAPAEEPATEEAPDEEPAAEETPAVEGADASADATPVTGVPSAPSPQAADTSLTDAQKEEIASLPTGVLEAVDAPIADVQPDAAAPTPTRRSLRHRHVAEESDQAADDQAAEPAAEGEEPKTPTRRPIVRIPAAAQGVRTVDTDTGQLSAVQPVIQPDAALQVSQGAAGEDEADDVEVFGGIDNPQWRSLTDAEAAGSEAADQAEAESAPAAAPAPEVEAEAASAEGEAVQAPAEAGSEPASAQTEGGSRAGHTLLIVLLAVVIALVVLAVVWFLYHNGIIGSLPQTLDTWTHLLV